ncbi:MAG: hypothetical protein Q9160_005784 [Pyrenula sp. 1 TL-2023]
MDRPAGHPDSAATTDSEKGAARDNRSETMIDSEEQSRKSLEHNAPPVQDVEKKPANPMMDPSSFPEGGTEAWLTVAGAAACLFVSFGWVNAVGFFQDYYERNQLKEYSPSQIAWISSLQVFFMLFGGTIVGKIFDDHGPHVPLMAGSFLHVFGLMMTSISKEYYQFLLSQAVCSAIGASMVFYPAFNCVTTWFFKKRGAAVGLVAAGSSLGGVIFPLMVIHLIPQVGFGWTLRICAFMILGLLIFANIAIRSRIAPTKRPFSLLAFVRPLREPTFVLLTAAVFFFYCAFSFPCPLHPLFSTKPPSFSLLGGMFIPFTFIVVSARTHGMSSRLADYLVPILNGASIIGRTVPNAIADRVGRFNTMIVMSAFTTILVLALWLPISTSATGGSSNAGIIAFAALFGIGSGAGIGLTPVLCAQISPIRDIGVRTGTVFAFASIAALTGSPIGGKIVTDTSEDFKWTIVFAGVSCTLGVGFFTAARVTSGGWGKGKI